MKHYFFDLDGTIIDSELGIKNAFKHTFNQLNLPIPDDTTLNSYIGPSLEVTFAEIFNGQEDFINQALGIYRKYYAEKGMGEAKIYPDIIETISELRKDGHKTYIATSKNEIVAKKMLNKFALSDYFDDITGSDSHKNSKTLVLEEAISKAKAPLSDSFMIGDRNHDIIGGQNNGLTTVGVLYGFGDYQELNQANADYIIEKPQGILNL